MKRRKWRPARKGVPCEYAVQIDIGQFGEVEVAVKYTCLKCGEESANENCDTPGVVECECGGRDWLRGSVSDRKMPHGPIATVGEMILLLRKFDPKARVYATWEGCGRLISLSKDSDGDAEIDADHDRIPRGWFERPDHDPR